MGGGSAWRFRPVVEQCESGGPKGQEQPLEGVWPKTAGGFDSPPTQNCSLMLVFVFGLVFACVYERE